MRIRSKYLNKSFGTWVCTYVGIAYVQRKRAKYAEHRTYYYIFERQTSDKKANKLIRLEAYEAAKVYNQKTTVESFAIKRAKRNQKTFTQKISYSFFK